MGNILITGGTGSLGSKLVDKLLSTKHAYEKIIVYSRNEHAQEKLRATLQHKFANADRVRYLIGDIRDYRRLNLALNKNNVHTIINAAALKVVPKGETDAIEFVKTNVNGVQNVIEAAIAHDVKKVIQVSTDKAVKPINLYGATKLTAEKLMLAANNIRGEKGPTFGFVRYGNVTGSQGSVIPLFIEQHRGGRPFTVTNTEMTRFWITLDEAAEFVLKSSRYMTRKKNIFIPHMPAYTLMDLCAAIGGERHVKYITGLRPGEKMHEDILNDDEYGLYPSVPKSSDKAKKLQSHEIAYMLAEEGLMRKKDFMRVNQTNYPFDKGVLAHV